MYLLQMIREKKLERRRQRRKTAERLQQDQEAEVMAVSPSNTSDQPQEPFDSITAKQHEPDAEVDRGRRRRRRRRPKQSSVDDDNSEKYENGWAVTRSESEHLAGALNNTDLLASRSEPHALNQDAPSLTPHPIVYSNVTTTLDNRDLTVQPTFLQRLPNDSDMESRPYCPPNQSNVCLCQLRSQTYVLPSLYCY